jgi:uncharacterized membrane protein YidH (DUF202 family)
MRIAPATGDDTQGERTRLAWRRTTLAPLALIAIAVAHLLVGRARPASAVASAAAGGLFAVLLMLLGWLSLYVVARRRMLALRAGSTARVVRSPAAVGLLCAAFAVPGLLLLLR